MGLYLGKPMPLIIKISQICWGIFIFSFLGIIGIGLSYDKGYPPETGNIAFVVFGIMTVSGSLAYILEKIDDRQRKKL